MLIEPVLILKGVLLRSALDFSLRLREERGITCLDLAYYIMFNGERDLLLTALPEGAILRRGLAACFGITRYDETWRYLSEVERDLRHEYEAYLSRAEERKEAKGILEDRGRRVKELEAEIDKKKEELENVRSRLREIEDRVEELDRLYAEISAIESDFEGKLRKPGEVSSLIEARRKDVEREKLTVERGEAS